MNFDVTAFLMEKYGDNWHEKYNDFVTWVAAQFQSGDYDRIVEQIQNELDITREEIMYLVGQALKDIIGRAEFESSQGRQDSKISFIEMSMDTGFDGTTVTFGFTPGELPQWKGYTGGSTLPEGAVNASNQLTL